MVEFSVLKKTRFSDLIKWNVSELLSNKVLGKYENQPLTNFLVRSKNAIEIKDEVLYKQVTIHQFGEGVSLRCEKYGKEIGTKRQFIAKKGQFIISRIDARNGSFGIVPDFLDGAIVTNDFWLFDIKNADAEFMRLLLSSKKINSFWQSKSNGTTNRQRVDFDDFIKSSLPIPKLEEQKAILQKYKENIEQAEHIEQKAEELNQNIGNELINLLGITVEPKIEKNHSLLTFVKHSRCSRWDVDYILGKHSVDYILTSKYPIINTRNIILSCQYGSSTKADKNSNNTPVLRMNNIQDGEFVINDLKYLNMSEKDLSTYKLNKGDLLFNRTNSKELVGKTAVFEFDSDYVFASYLIRVVIDSRKANVHYISYLFGSKIIRDQINSISRQITGQANVNAEELKDFIFPLPPLSVQNEIVSHINQIKKQVKDLREQAKILREQAKKEFEESVFE